MKSVYLGMSIDIFHHGHINIIEKASKYGELTIGLLTDKAIASHKRLPLLSYEQRYEIIKNIKGVHSVVPQEEWDYAPNIKKYKPSIMVHGDDWLEGPLFPLREMALNALNSYGGKLIEIPYTKDISSTDLVNSLYSNGITTETRKKTLKRLLQIKPIIRFIEAHSPISAIIAEKASFSVKNVNREFDGFWSSSLTDSIEMGMPDIEALDVSKRLYNIGNIFDVTTKPLIMDLDTGGKVEHFQINIRTIERLGISAVIIEDKKGLKKNSLFGNEVAQDQEDPDVFAEKIAIGRANRLSSDFMIIARIESLILEKGMDDAIYRAEKYVKAGADGIMIHSRLKEPDEIFNFAKLFRSYFKHVPLVCVPTSYNHVRENDLQNIGFNIVIYANHLMRSSYPAMQSVAESILKYGRSAEVDKELISIKDVLELIPGTK
tara:strand:- start:124 stop:1422 length:1299 start_codon:yes stop_codon:yes gene_type:complete